MLWAPRIPQNAGQIARTCWAMNSALHLVRPLGFRVDAPALRRAAVGYWDRLDVTVHADGHALWRAIGDAGRAWLVTRHGRVPYHAAPFRRGDWLIFGNETEGLPSDWLEAHAERTLVIPMLNDEARCLNLATAASVVHLEALRSVRAAD